jgi:hypothetical protein
MLIITIKVDAPAGQAIGIKEDLAYYLERFGDVKSVDVEEEQKVYCNTWLQNWHETKEE